MMALLSPRVWLALALAAVLALTHGFAYRSGKAKLRAAWDAEKVIQLNDQKEAERENRNIESARANNVIVAQNAAVLRNRSLQADAVGARSESQRLCDALETAAVALRLPGDTCSASIDNAAAVGQLLAQCAAAYTDLAGKADGHANDAKTLSEAWPVR